MEKHVYYRIFGHALSSYLQITHFLEVLRKLEVALPTQPKLQEFVDLCPTYFTLWNVFGQLVYAFIAILCDVTTALKVEWIVPKWIRYHRHTFGLALLFPVSLAVLSFWGYFLVDREVVLPAFLDAIISPCCNFLWHFAIIIYAIWEMSFLPKDGRDTSASFKLLNIINCTYIAYIFYSRYLGFGAWPYRILKMTEGTMLFPLVLGEMYLLTIIGYFIQFRLKDYIWKSNVQKKE